VYYELRRNFQLGAQMSCTCSQQVTSTYKMLWNRVKDNAKKLKAGKAKRRYKGLDQPPCYKALTVTLQYNRDYSWGKDSTVSIPTLDGRIKLEYRGYQKHLDMIRDGAPTGAAKLYYDKTSKQWYLIVSIELTRQDIDPKSLTKVKGVDMGQRCLYVSTDTEGKTKFEHGGKVKSQCRHYTRVRKGLRSKGTRSAKRVLTRTAYRERRFRSDVNHKLALGVLEPSILVGMEDLVRCAESTMQKRKKAGSGASPKQKQANREHSSWAYAELRSFVEYKAFFFDSVVAPVDAKNTSKGCRKCGNVDALNRPNGSLIFKCTCCGHTVHSDKNGADNILFRTLGRRHSLFPTGHLSAAPEVVQAAAKVPDVDGHQAGVMGQAARSSAER
jgi:transposase